MNFTGIDLSRRTNTSIPRQIKFVRKLEEDDSVTKLVKNYSKLFFRLINCHRII